jgi:hypothetical protein
MANKQGHQQHKFPTLTDIFAERRANVNTRSPARPDRLFRAAICLRRAL